ncbi:MAG: hypothetical protein P9M13_05365 [Candidatus Ancaeobacter aquaticus]|nr:hypothetical protein [Candidatus Ancaeobacter aquaticus]
MIKIAAKLFFIGVCLSIAVISYAEEKSGPNETVAKVNDTVITVKQVNNIIDSVPGDFRSIIKYKKTGLVNDIVDREILYQNAIKKGYENDSDVLSSLKMIKKQLIAEWYLKKEVSDNAVVSDVEVKEYFDKNPDEFGISKGQAQSYIDKKFMKTKDSIRESLLMQKRVDTVRLFIDELRSNADITINQDVIDRIE